MSEVITIKNITKVFSEDGTDSFVALKNIDLEISEGEFFILLGPSGSGKSTLLRIMSGLEKKYEGGLKYGPGFSTNDISFVFQQFGLMPWLTVYKNVELALIGRKVPESERKEKIESVLKEMGLEKFAKLRPRELSGGMKQRVGIARALVTDPKIIFLDEPFSELDSFTARELRQMLLDIWARKKMTIIMVTHLTEEAVQLGDRIAVMTERPGTIEKIVINHIPRPRSFRSAEFFELQDELYKLVKPKNADIRN